MFEFFNPRLMYLILLPLCAVLCITGGILLLKVNKENLEKREKLPRAALPGAILGIIDLLWCIPNAMPILPESLHKYLLPLAILLIILAYCALDHLFSRAIGGFMILTAHFYLKESFASPTILSAVFATLCLIFGTIGIFISGKPHLTREIIRLSVTKYRPAMPLFLFLFAAVSIMTFILNLAGADKL